MSFTTISNIEPDYSIESILSALDMYNEIINSADGMVGIERFNTLLIPFTGTFNLINRIICNFTVRITKIGKAVKRSELKVYHDKYPLNCKRALNVNYVDIAEEDISVPNSMKSTYALTTANISKFYTTVGIDIFKLFYDNMAFLSRYIATKNLPLNEKIFNDISQVKNQSDLLREEMFMKHVDDFDNKIKDVYVAFKTKFNSMEEFRETDKTLLSLNSVITDIGKIAKVIEDTAKITHSTVEYIKASDNRPELITSDFLKNLSDYIRNMAEAYDMYASVIESQVAVEHNFCKVLEKIYTVS